MSYYLEPLIGEKEAARKMNDHLSSAWWKKLWKKKTLTAVEELRLPFWCFDYEAVTHTVPEGMKGRIAIEPLSRMNAILPADYEVTYKEEAGMEILETLGNEEAERVLYWELFAKEKRREKNKVSISGRWLVYVPYWIGYTKDAEGLFDILAVDALNGKVDLPMKDTVLHYLMDGREEMKK
ncbi:hypothetical protein U0355_12715 [Salimicrobium sp. PL1-032A]|uniref:hypothetical protein n=1 Tax=Salimicrobium sp. PL1-032A TaxID=3095364 RepID=UPI003260F251